MAILSKKINKTKDELYDLWCKVCNDYVAELSRKWFNEVESFYWVGGDVGGECCLNEDWFLNMDDVRYCVCNNVSLDEYDAWTSYLEDANEFKLPNINLKSWHLGCPRFSKQEIEHLRELKQNLIKEITSIKEKYGRNE